MKYESIPVNVQAWRIAEILEKTDDGKMVLRLEGNPNNLVASAEMLAQYRPTPGDFFVHHESGAMQLMAVSIFNTRFRQKEN